MQKLAAQVEFLWHYFSFLCICIARDEQEIGWHPESIEPSQRRQWIDSLESHKLHKLGAELIPHIFGLQSCDTFGTTFTNVIDPKLKPPSTASQLTFYSNLLLYGKDTTHHKLRWIWSCPSRHSTYLHSLKLFGVEELRMQIIKSSSYTITI